MVVLGLIANESHVSSTEKYIVLNSCRGLSVHPRVLTGGHHNTFQGPFESRWPQDGTWHVLIREL